MNYIGVLRDQLQDMMRGAVAILPNLAVALIVLLATWLIARFATHIAERITRRAQVRDDLKRLVETLVKLGIWIFGILLAAAIVVPGFTLGGMIAGLGIGAVAIGFAFQDIFENFLAGVLIMLREKMQIGDVIECEGILGKVEQISLRETHIRQLSNELTVLPNSMLFKNPVKIFTDDAIRRTEVVVGVSYDTDLQHAKTVISEAMKKLDILEKDRPVDIFAQEFNSSSVDFLVRWWTNSKPRDLRETKSRVIFAIKNALDDAGIEIPFPYVTHTFKEAVPFANAPDKAVG